MRAPRGNRALSCAVNLALPPARRCRGGIIGLDHILVCPGSSSIALKLVNLSPYDVFFIHYILVPLSIVIITIYCIFSGSQGLAFSYLQEKINKSNHKYGAQNINIYTMQHDLVTSNSKDSKTKGVQRI